MKKVLKKGLKKVMKVLKKSESYSGYENSRNFNRPIFTNLGFVVQLVPKAVVYVKCYSICKMYSKM